jgi:hypothetical protein
MNEGPEKPDPTEPFRPAEPPPGGTPPGGTPPGTPPPPPPGPGTTPTQPFQPAGTAPTPPVGAAPPATQFSGAPPTGERRRNPGKFALVAVVALLLVGGVAFAAIKIFGALAGTEDILDDKVPANSVAYVTAYLDPGASQKLNLKNLAGKFPALAGRDLTQTVNQGLDGLSSQVGLSFTRDIEPWLGTQIALSVVQNGDSSSPVLLINSTDDQKAKVALTRTESAGSEQLKWRSEDHNGVTIRVGELSIPGVEQALAQRAYAITDNTVIVGENADGVGAVIDTAQGDAPSLGDDETYKDTVEALPKSVLGLAFVNLRSAAGAIIGASGSASGVAVPTTPAAAVGQLQPNPLQALEAFRGLGLSLSAEKEGIRLDFGITIDKSKLTPEQQALIGGDDTDNGTLQSVPSRAYGMLGLTGLDKVAGGFIQQAQANPAFARIAQQLNLASVVSHLSGDASLEVGPGRTQFPGGAVLIGTDDEAGMQRFLDDAARQLLQGSGGPSPIQSETYKGVTIHFAQIPDAEQVGAEPAYAVANGMAIIATTPDEVKAVIDAPDGTNIQSAPTFQTASAQIPQGSSLLYLDVQAILGALQPQLESAFGATFTQLIAPNAKPVKAIILTGENGEKAALAHLFILIQ